MRNPLPECIDPERLAAAGQVLTGLWPASRCQRLAASAYRLLSDIHVELMLTKLQPGQFDMQGRIKVELEVLCQRCLQTLVWSMDETVQLRLVAAGTEVEFDALELDEHGQIAVAQWLEDEVMLKLPLVTVHENVQHCDANMLRRAKEYVHTDDVRQHPFAVLKQLKD